MFDIMPIEIQVQYEFCDYCDNNIENKLRKHF